MIIPLYLILTFNFLLPPRQKLDLHEAKDNRIDKTTKCT